jgi:hypothetical protein
LESRIARAHVGLPFWCPKPTITRATRQRHLAAIREYLHVPPYGPTARHAMIRTLAEAASTKYELET